jgi:hypothetical protein
MRASTHGPAPARSWLVEPALIEAPYDHTRRHLGRGPVVTPGSRRARSNCSDPATQSRPAVRRATLTAPGRFCRHERSKSRSTIRRTVIRCRCVRSRFGVVERLDETGATGLEPATSGVTGRARASMILNRPTQRNPASREFGSASNVGSPNLARPSPMFPPHPGPIAASSSKTTEWYKRDSAGTPQPVALDSDFAYGLATSAWRRNGPRLRWRDNGRPRRPPVAIDRRARFYRAGGRRTLLMT